MPQPDRLVAGLRCREVLADLSSFMDGELPQDRVEQINTHLRGCDWCERFGGRFTGIIAQFRRQLAAAEPLGVSVEQRLRERLRRDLP
jgi:anti-sigma factor RsiW